MVRAAIKHGWSNFQITQLCCDSDIVRAQGRKRVVASKKQRHQYCRSAVPGKVFHTNGVMFGPASTQTVLYILVLQSCGKPIAYLSPVSCLLLACVGLTGVMCVLVQHDNIMLCCLMKTRHFAQKYIPYIGCDAQQHDSTH